MYQHGWYQIAFERDLIDELTPIVFADKRLMAVKQPTGVRVVDASCPHRGAHLAYGGELRGELIVCPFHGYKTSIGEGSNGSQGDFCVREYPTLVRGGLVLVRLSDMEAPNFPLALEELEKDHTFVRGFEIEADTSIEIVMENGFDCLHFKAVHGLLNEPEFEIGTGPFGELTAKGTFEFPPFDGSASSPSMEARYQIGLFSPGGALSTLDGEPPFNYSVVTTAVPATEEGKCIVRLTVAFPTDPSGAAPDEQLVQGLIRYMRKGFEQDLEIWNHLSLDTPAQWTQRDRPALELIRFCEQFRNGSPAGPSGRHRANGI